MPREKHGGGAVRLLQGVVVTVARRDTPGVDPVQSSDFLALGFGHHLYYHPLTEPILG